MPTADTFYSAAILKQWDMLQSFLGRSQQILEIDGNSVDIPSLVAVARHGSHVQLQESCIPTIEKSSAYCQLCLAEGHSIYGVNTGFGGSADTRTDKTVELQSNLIGFLNCGVTVHRDTNRSDPTSATTLPEAWVRASLLVRANSLSRGHSGVRPAVITGLLNFINDGISPVIPLRGSISASGDLIPLSYIAGALQGRNGIQVWVDVRSTPATDLAFNMDTPESQTIPARPTEHYSGSVSKPLDNAHHSTSNPRSATRSESSSSSCKGKFKQYPRQIVGARDALAMYKLVPLKLEPKEGLALVNGTAVSAGTGALVIHDAQGIALLAQVLTAMSVEASTGTIESFEPFISQVRPHKGQIEATHNIRHFLKGSKLARQGLDDELQDQGGLRQDRYSLRTTPQWIGPQLENLALAYQQVEIECNSTTDNPLLDTDQRRIFHGGNFQALAVTSAMEKVRQSIQQLGRMLFVQCSELINPDFNNGLPPNLEAGEPSQGFLAKGIDISVAALCSELGYLANPVTPHVQTAEMGNQSLNSLAFLSARYSHTAIEVISQLAAAHVFVVCQALDLRCIQRIFHGRLQPKMNAITRTILGKHVKAGAFPTLRKQLWSRFCMELDRTTNQDSVERFHNIFKSLQPEILSMSELENTAHLVTSLEQWTSAAAQEALHLHRDCLVDYISQPSAKDYLGPASYRMWQYVRLELAVPFHAGTSGFWNLLHKNEDAPVGEMIIKIYFAIKEGGLIGVVMDCMREARVTIDRRQAKL